MPQQQQQSASSPASSEVEFRLRLEDCSAPGTTTTTTTASADVNDERRPLTQSSSSSSSHPPPPTTKRHQTTTTSKRVEYVGLSSVDSGLNNTSIAATSMSRPTGSSGARPTTERTRWNSSSASSASASFSNPRHQARKSLLGKPINFRAHRRDARYRRLQAKTYNFLERPKNWKSVSYHLLVFLMIFLCLLLSVFATIEQYEEVAGTALYYLELLMAVWFASEYLVRIWSVGCRSRYQSISGRLEFMRRPLCIVDLIVIGASVIILCLGAGSVFATSALRSLRFFQILRMVRVDRRGGSWKLLGSVVWVHRQELFTTLYIGFLGLIFASFLMYLAEKERNPKKFGTYADALWWGVITLCTVGYGDTVPITWHGKLIAAGCAILGISFFALPAGILGSGFALKVQQQQRQKHLIRRKGPAAILIQSLWRCYAADENSLSTATWKPHFRPCKTTQSQRLKHNASFMSRLSTRRKDTAAAAATAAVVNSVHGSTGLPSPMLLKKKILRRTYCHATPQTPTTLSEDRDLDSLESDRSRLSLNDLSIARSLSSTGRINDFKDSEDDLDETEGVTLLTDVHKRVIRSLRKIKFFVARRKFKEAFRPYDVKDVIEQYSAGNLDMLTRIKSLQSRLDVILGKVGSKKADVYESKISLASRIVKVERQVEDIESKLDALIEMYKEDRTKTPEETAQNTTTANCIELHHPHPHSPPPPPPPQQPPTRAQTVRHQSEPSTPIVKNPVKPMLRNLSDLGPRIKKRVTIGGAVDGGGCRSSEVLFYAPPPKPLSQLYPIIDASQVEVSSSEEGAEEEGIGADDEPTGEKGAAASRRHGLGKVTQRRATVVMGSGSSASSNVLEREYGGGFTEEECLDATMTTSARNNIAKAKYHEMNGSREQSSAQNR